MSNNVSETSIISFLQKKKDSSGGVMSEQSARVPRSLRYFEANPKDLFDARTEWTRGGPRSTSRQLLTFLIDSLARNFSNTLPTRGLLRIVTRHVFVSLWQVSRSLIGHCVYDTCRPYAQWTPLYERVDTGPLPRDFTPSSFFF